VNLMKFDVMNDLAFGGCSDMMRTGDIDGLWHLLEAGEKNLLFMGHVPWLGALCLRLPGLAGDLKAFRAYAAKKAGSTYKDIFYHLIDEGGITNEPASAMRLSMILH